MAGSSKVLFGCGSGEARLWVAGLIGNTGQNDSDVSRYGFPYFPVSGDVGPAVLEDRCCRFARSANGDGITSLPRGQEEGRGTGMMVERQSSEEEGQALLEFAVSLPILLVVVTGILAFGLVLNNYVILTNATDNGARALSISRGQTTDPCATTVNAVYTAAPILRQSGYTFAITLNGTKYTGTSCNSSAAVANMVQGAQAQVTVTYPCSLAMYGMNAAPTCMLQAQTTEIIQ
jgi:Flp pilus assembly protein TadG